MDVPPRPVSRGWVPASSATSKGVKASTGELPAASPPESGQRRAGDTPGSGSRSEPYFSPKP